ncbi:aminodeoxychorismate/anthranilate synthase component II [Halobacillus rhizosphaerae]|uniref:anthranilate synthase component II n=1 Tax=Halobacillus rhizosphaerae TaxID=3064889 RepID=UPI00398B0350
MILMIDNYDSFTYNLFQYFKQMDDEVLVFRNDEVTLQEMDALNPDLIVLSPGPGSPSESGICREVIKSYYLHTPILGICLGHQLIVDFFGGEIRKGKQPVHGKVTAIRHDGKFLFRNIPASIRVTRYHSLVIAEDNLPSTLQISAISEDNVVMGVRHAEAPLEGIQFHPESILTEYGFEMLKNAYEQAVQFQRNRMEVCR